MENTRRLIVFEAEPYWEPELGRRFQGESVDVGACRSVRDLETRTSREQADLVVLDLAADVAGSLRWLARMVDPLPVIVVAGEEEASLEWHVRELGAVAFVDEFIGGARMAAVCRKLWCD